MLDGAPEDTRASADAIAESMPGVAVAQTIGRTIVLYHPFPDEPELDLPG